MRVEPEPRVLHEERVPRARMWHCLTLEVLQESSSRSVVALSNAAIGSRAAKGRAGVHVRGRRVVLAGYPTSSNL